MLGANEHAAARTLDVPSGEDSDVKRGRVEYDCAYGCFLFCGLAALSGSLMEAIPKDEGTTVLLGYFVAIPLVLASFVALLSGIVLCLRLWKHWPLVILSAMSVLFVAALFIGHGSATFYYAVSITYSAGVVAICARWFLILRTKGIPTPATTGGAVQSADTVDGEMRRR